VPAILSEEPAEILIFPATSSFCEGEAVPIPTLPALSILNRSAPAVVTASASVAGQYIPVFESLKFDNEGVPANPALTPMP